MASTTESKQKKLQPREKITRAIKDAQEVNKIFSRIAGNESKAQIKPEGSEKQFQAVVCDSSTPKRGLRLRAATPEQGAQLKKLLEKSRGIRCYVLAFMSGTAVVGVHSKFVAIEDGEFIFEYPEEAIKIQRRQQARFWILGGYDIQVEMTAIEGSRRRVKKRLLDISASGLAFHVISPREAALFRPGTLLRNLQLRLHNQDLQLDAEVRNSEPLSERTGLQGHRVGVRFLKISPEDAGFIETFVLYHVGHTLT